MRIRAPKKGGWGCISSNSLEMRIRVPKQGGWGCIFSNSLVIFLKIYLTLILLRLFQQHYCYNVTGQSQESEGSCKPARIKEVHSKLHSFQASLCTLTATHLTLIYVCTYIRLSVPLGCLIKQAGIIIHTILNMWETPGIEPVTSDLTSVYQISSSTNWAIPPHCQVNPVPITAW